MYNIGNLVFNLTMVLSTVWIINKYLNTYLEKRKGNALATVSWIAYVIFQMYVHQHNGTASIWTTIISIVLVQIISVNSYKKKGKTKLFLVIIFYVVWSLIEMTVFFCVNNIDLFLNQQIKDTIGNVISKIIMIITIYIFSIVWSKKNGETISFRYYAFLLFIPVGSIYIAVYEFFMEKYLDNAIHTMITFSILLVFNIIVYEIYFRLSESFMVEQEKTVYVQQVNFVTKSLEEQKRIMEEFYKEKHDLVNELIVLKKSVENSEKEDAIASINRIINVYDVGEQYINCGNSVIDAIVNFKYAIAKEQGIEFAVKIFIPEILLINQCDMGIVLGNALDNAIEAVKCCEQDKKTIQIFMGIKKESLVLIIKNPYEHCIKVDRDGNLLTTKKEYKGHGYGVCSIKRVVNKYNGEVLIDTQDSLFTITIVMNFEEL